MKKILNYLYKYAQNHGARTHYQLDIDGSSVTTSDVPARLGPQLRLGFYGLRLVKFEA